MGADERVFAPQMREIPQLTVPRWLPPQSPNESLASYAARMARHVDPGRPCFVGGASFGGFVALEMARHLQTRACFLIGSVRSPRELPARITMLRSAGRAIPHLPWELLCRIAGLGVIALGQCSTPATRSFFEQLSDSDANFLRWATRAVLTWQPDERAFDFPIHHIHGARDHVLPAARTRSDRLVAGAGHVLSLTHADEVTEFLKQHMRSTAPTEHATL